MRALELTQRFPPALGGVENHVWHLAEGLRKRGVDVEVFATDLQKDIPRQRLPEGGPEFAYPVKRFRTVKVADLPHALGNVAPGMLPELLSGHWDVLHAHAYGYFPSFAATLGGILDRSALVITPHSDPGRPTLEKRAFDRVVPSVTLRRANRVIALTPTEARYLESLGVAREQIAIIPNGVDMEEFATTQPAAHPPDEMRLLFAGRCYPDQKGLRVLLEAMTLLRPDPRIHLRIVGEDWGGHAVVRSMARRAGIEDRIVLVGRVDRRTLIEEFHAADVFVLPSLFDSFPIAILEAMASGLPVIASRVGGIPDVVADGETGFLVEPGNASELASAVVRLADSPSLRATMGDRGRERARSYSWDVVVPRVMDVYREAVQECA